MLDGYYMLLLFEQLEEIAMFNLSSVWINSVGVRVVIRYLSAAFERWANMTVVI